MIDARTASASGAAFDGAMGAQHGVLYTLLRELGWRGEMRTFLEALPHAAETLDLVDARAVLARLGFFTVERRPRADCVPDSVLPALIARDGGDFGVLVRRNGVLHLITAEAPKGAPLSVGRERLRLWHAAEIPQNDKENDPARWLANAARHMQPFLGRIVVTTLVLNLTAVILPLYVLGVYDIAMSGRSTVALASLVAAVLGWLVIDSAIRSRRSEVIAHLGGRIDYLVGSETLQRILALPMSASQASSRGDQLAVLRQFERIREIFTGTLAVMLLDLPFVFLLVAALFLIAGPLGWVPVVLLLIFTAMGAIGFPIAAAHLTRQAVARQERDSLTLEMLSRHRAIREHGGERRWLERIRTHAVAYALEDLRGSRLMTSLQVVSSALVTMAGILILALGARQVIDGVLSPGALMAAMALTWRCLAPVDSLFIGFFRLGSMRLCIQQLDRLLKMRPERPRARLPRFKRRIGGAIEVRNLSFRYQARAEPALFGLSLDIKPGEFIAVAGPSGSGKSTLLRMLLGLYLPQIGTIRIDGLDIRQIDPWEMRATTGYAPQDSDLFYGTLAQNLRLAEPDAGNVAISQAIVDSDLLDFVTNLNEGAHTRMSEHAWANAGPGRKQRMGLARAYLRHPTLLLLDEPAAHLDAAGDEALMRKLQSLRGKVTVVMTTHRPSYMRAADRVIYLEAGRKRFEGSAADLELALSRNQARTPATPPEPAGAPLPATQKGAA